MVDQKRQSGPWISTSGLFSVLTLLAGQQKQHQEGKRAHPIIIKTSVLDYLVQPNHESLQTKSQIERLEAVQRRAIKIIFCCSSSTSYLTTLELAGILSLQARRVDLSKRLFRNICRPDNCLLHLLPPPRDIAVTSRLRKPTTYPRPNLRTKRYCSAVSYALLNFQ